MTLEGQALLNKYYDGQVSLHVKPNVAPGFYERFGKEENGQLGMNIRFYVALVPSLHERYSESYIDRVEGIRRRPHPPSHRDTCPPFFASGL